MTHLVTDVPLAAPLPGVTFRGLPPHREPWDLPSDLLPVTEVLLCRHLPRNFDAAPNLQFVQLSSVGYEQLRHHTYVQPGTGDPDGVLPDRVFVAGQERDFLAGLDFLVLALPHTRQSDGMVGEEQLRALPRTAFLLNPARGPLVREPALLRA